jgi:hypothetical protein
MKYVMWRNGADAYSRAHYEDARLRDAPALSLSAGALGEYR